MVEGEEEEEEEEEESEESEGDKELDATLACSVESARRRVCLDGLMAWRRSTVSSCGRAAVRFFLETLVGFDASGDGAAKAPKPRETTEGSRPCLERRLAAAEELDDLTPRFLRCPFILLFFSWALFLRRGVGWGGSVGILEMEFFNIGV